MHVLCMVLCPPHIEPIATAVTMATAVTTGIHALLTCPADEVIQQDGQQDAMLTTPEESSVPPPSSDASPHVPGGEQDASAPLPVVGTAVQVTETTDALDCAPDSSATGTVDGTAGGTAEPVDNADADDTAAGAAGMGQCTMHHVPHQIHILQIGTQQLERLRLPACYSV